MAPRGNRLQSGYRPLQNRENSGHMNLERLPGNIIPGVPGILIQFDNAARAALFAVRSVFYTDKTNRIISRKASCK